MQLHSLLFSFSLHSFSRIHPPPKPVDSSFLPFHTTPPHTLKRQNSAYLLEQIRNLIGRHCDDLFGALSADLPDLETRTTTVQHTTRGTTRALQVPTAGRRLRVFRQILHTFFVPCEEKTTAARKRDETMKFYFFAAAISTDRRLLLLVSRRRVTDERFTRKHAKFVRWRKKDWFGGVRKCPSEQCCQNEKDRKTHHRYDLLIRVLLIRICSILQ